MLAELSVSDSILLSKAAKLIFSLQIHSASVKHNQTLNQITQVRLLQLQWNSKGGLAGASMELALPDTARLLRCTILAKFMTLFFLGFSSLFGRPLQSTMKCLR